jgi:hypothetical protein
VAGIENSAADADLRLRKLDAFRKRAGLRIDPETAELHWEYGETLDPYGDWAHTPDELSQIGRELFARAPGTDVWIHFHDLPDATREALWKRIERNGSSAIS